MHITVMRTAHRKQVKQEHSLSRYATVTVPKSRTKWIWVVSKSNHATFRPGDRVYPWEILMLKLGGHQVTKTEDGGLRWAA